MNSEQKNLLYYTYKETMERDYHDGQRYGDWEQIKNWSLKDVFISNPCDLSVYWDSVTVKDAPKVGDGVYVVVVRYESGNTFGRSYGNGTVAGIYSTISEANEAKKLIENKKWKGYAEWSGYFERLEEVEIETRIIMELK